MEDRLPRKLAAILYADVAGYSRLTGEDEDATHRKLSEYLDLISNSVQQHRGRVMHYAGDAVLAMFEAVLDALSCAVEVQKDLKTRNEHLPNERKVQFRIGVNLGDVIEDRGDIYGDGVNVAARLESLAYPGGICISATVYDTVGTRLPIAYESLGELSVKNIERPVRAYRVALGLESEQPTSSHVTPAQFAFSRPAIAVLPFTNLSRDSDQEYFADGLTEDIITALADWRAFPVIARNSTFVYKGQSPRPSQLAADFGVRYVVEGSVRKSGNRLRVTAQLVDSTIDHHVWAARYDRELADVFDIQDELTEQIVATIEPEVERAEQRRATAKKRSSLDAWDCYQRGMAYLYKFTEEGNREARGWFREAMKLDSNYGQPFTGTALSHCRDISQVFTDSRERSLGEALEAARRGVELDDSDSTAHRVLGFAYSLLEDHDRAIAEPRRAITLNPSNAIAYGNLGYALGLAGMPKEGISYLEKGLQLNPRDPQNHISINSLALVHFSARQYEEAIKCARRAIAEHSDHPDAYCILALCLGYLGRETEARLALAECERLRPGFAQRRAAQQPFKNPGDQAHFQEGFRKAGLERSEDS